MNCHIKSFILLIVFSLGLLTSLSGCMGIEKSSTSKPLNEKSLISEKLVTLESRPGVKLKFLLTKPKKSIGSIILFPGGPGMLKLKESFGKPWIYRAKDIYLVRNRINYAKNGLTVALMDVPSDCRLKGSMGVQTQNGHSYKMSKELLQDVQAVTRYLKNIQNSPVWVMGTSRGTVPVAHIGVNNIPFVDGLVFSSPLTLRGPIHQSLLKNYPNGILDMELDKIKVPVLITAHRDDYCTFTQYPGKLSRKLTNAKNVQLGYFSGGKKPETGDCEWFSPHGFYGIEEQVDRKVSQFIKATIDKKYPKPKFNPEYTSMLEHESITFEQIKGEKIKIIVAKHSSPTGVFVMFGNYSGILNIMESSEGPVIVNGFTTVARCMNRLAKLGYVVVLVDSINSKPLTCSQRVNFKYLQQIRPVFSYVKEQFDLPLWCVGQGAGGFSAVNATLNIPGIDALILISPITKAKRKDPFINLEDGFLGLDLTGILVPTFLIAHTKDHSGVSGPTAAKAVYKKLINSPLKGIDIISKGRVNKMRWGKIPHYFGGRSDILVNSIYKITELNL